MSQHDGKSKRWPKSLAAITGGVGGIERPDISKEDMGKLFDSATKVAMNQSHYGNADTKIKHDPITGPEFAPTTPVPQGKPGKKC